MAKSILSHFTYGQAAFSRHEDYSLSLIPSRVSPSYTMRLHILFLVPLFMGLASSGWAQQPSGAIARMIDSRAISFEGLPISALLLAQVDLSVRTQGVADVVGDALFLRLDGQQYANLRRDRPDQLRFSLTFPDQQVRVLRLTRASVTSPSFQVTAASDRHRAWPWDEGLHYWGVVEGDPHSLTAISLNRDEIMGFIQLEDHHFTLGLMEGDRSGLHILYQDSELRIAPDIACHTDDVAHYIGTPDDGEGERQGQDKCVRMYVEVDYDIFTGKGGMQQATDYVMGAFSQVAILYANDDLQVVVNELFVWNVTDPYTGPNTSNYLTQFRNYQNGNYNGDLAHLVGYNGGGGIAYLDVVCNSYYGVGYSAINATYQNVPTYSWTIMVLAHEIGHNLGSQHTHACAWNGNNTRIDNCGGQAGYTEGNCNSNPPLPANGGTIMSYCHLIGGVGINFNHGFGPQPADRMRNRVNNASCLSTCGPPIQHDAGIAAILAPEEFPCANNASPIVRLRNFGTQTLTAVTIVSQLDNGSLQNYAWTGSLAKDAVTEVTLPSISYGPGTHTFRAYTEQPNGQNDENGANDESQTSFNYIEGYCDCNEATGNLAPNPLNHTGGGSSNASIALSAGSKNVSFTISGLGAKLNGAQNTRYNERVIVTWVNGNGQAQTYGTYLGSQQSSVSVVINDFVQSVSVALSNQLNNGYNGTLSVSFSPVAYCSGEPPCADADGDGVCDEDDICPGFDDNLIGTACDDNDACTSGDVYTVNCLCEGTPIPGCGEECQNELTSNLSPNPRTHQGAGASNATASFPAGNQGAAFTVFNMDSWLSGNPNQRYNDQVTVTWVDGNGATQNYGTFLGSQNSSVDVSITGLVQSVTVALSNGHAPNNQALSVSMTAVTSCLPAQEPLQEGLPASVSSGPAVYPNPTTGELFLLWPESVGSTDIRVFNAYGAAIGHYRFQAGETQRLDLRPLHSAAGWVYLYIQSEGLVAPVTRKVMLVD
jgi:hypothetical protein